MSAGHELHDYLSSGFPVRVAIVVAPTVVRGYAGFPKFSGIGNGIALRGTHVLIKTATIADQDMRLQTADFRINLLSAPRIILRTAIVEEVIHPPIVRHEFTELCMDHLDILLPADRIPFRAGRERWIAPIGNTIV